MDKEIIEKCRKFKEMQALDKHNMEASSSQNHSAIGFSDAININVAPS